MNKECHLCQWHSEDWTARDRSHEGHLVKHLIGFVIISTTIKPEFYVP
jgi:hypothetical protein